LNSALAFGRRQASEAGPRSLHERCSTRRSLRAGPRIPERVVIVGAPTPRGCRAASATQGPPATGTGSAFFAEPRPRSPPARRHHMGHANFMGAPSSRDGRGPRRGRAVELIGELARWRLGVEWGAYPPRSSETVYRAGLGRESRGGAEMGCAHPLAETGRNHGGLLTSQ